MFELRWYQEEGINALMNYNYQHNPLLAFPTGCHAKGHLILMADGSVKPVEDIKVGDKLMGVNSQPRTVLALARGRQEMRKIIPNKGRPFVVNLDHKLPVWVTQSHDNRVYDCEKSKEEIITVRQYENGSNWYRHLRKLKIGTCDFPTKSLDIPPYVLGVLLGDGCFRNGRVSLTTMDQECDFAVSEYAEALGLTVKRSAKDNDSLAWEVNFVGTKKVDNILYHKIKMLNLVEKLSIEKFIPFDYKTGDRNQRLELLAGLIDTDGYLNQRSNTFEYATSSQQLCEDIRFICKSLGLRVNHRVKTTKCKVAYILQISGNVEMLPLRVPRRKPRPSKLNKRSDVTGFKVEKLPIDDYYGFTLDGDKLYLDSEFVIHHNTGKSVIIAEFIKRALIQFPTTRVMMLTHVGELVAQNAEKLKGVWQQAPLGVYSASLNERDVGRPITFGNMQSVYNYIKKQTENNQPHFGRIDLLIVDEAHLISEKDETTYRKIISALYAENPYIKVIGLTATPYRMKTGMLTENGIFGEVIYDLTQPDMFVRLIKEGYLAPLIPKRTSIEIDVSNVSLVANEYNLKQLEQVSDTDEITFNAVREIVECGLSQNRTSWIIFCTSVQHCEHVNAMLLSLGISSAVCHSKLSKKENDDVIHAFKQGRLTCLVNNNKLTTGFDNPKIDLIGMLRPTQSVGLWCLDDETEILTTSGWRNKDSIKTTDSVFAYNIDKQQGCVSKIKGKVTRPLYEGEYFVAGKNQNVDFCVTERHNLLVSTRSGMAKKYSNFSLMPAEKVLHIKDTFKLPCAINLELDDINLSDAELFFLGMFMTDGTLDKSNNQITIYQSAKYPEIQKRLDSVFMQLGFPLRKTETIGDVCFGKPRTTQMTRWQVSKKYWGYLENYVSKNFPETLQYLSSRQFKVLLEAINCGDGAKTDCGSYKHKTYQISTDNKIFADNLQRCAVTHGFSCKIVSRSDSVLLLHFKETFERTMRPEQVNALPSKKSDVWCVETDAGTIITRRNGIVTIMGNCQMLGRGTRPYPTKRDCLVLDFAGNTKRLGCINDPNIPKGKRKKGGGGTGEAPVKVCKECNCYNHAKARFCEVCGTEFTFESNLFNTASTLELIKDTSPQFELIPVDQVIYNEHKSANGGVPTLEVTYLCGLSKFKEYVCFEHSGYARKRAEMWWGQRSAEQCPDRVYEVLGRADSLKKPSMITVHINKKYPEIKSVTF